MEADSSSIKEGNVVETKSLESGETFDSTDAQLLALGFKPELKRVHTFWTLMAYQTTILCSWSCNIVLFDFIFTVGGVGSLVWGTLIVGIGQTLLMASLAEYCGIWPTAGGQCFYTQMVAPPKMRRFLSFVVAWSILVGEVSTSSSCALNSAQIVEALVQITHPEFHWRAWMTWLIYSGFLIAPTLSNLGPIFLKRLNIFGAFFNIGSFFVWAVVFLALAPKNSASFVFTHLINTTGWKSDAWVFVLSMYAPIYGLYGTDGVMHLVEDMKDPARDAPRVMIWAMVWATMTAWLAAIVLGFTSGGWEHYLHNMQSYVNWFVGVTDSVYGGGIFCAIIMMGLNYLIITNMNAAGSRVVWTIAKDGGFPCSNYFAQLSPRFNVPVRASLAFIAMNLAVGLLVLGSDLAFWAIISGGGVAFQVAYSVPIICVVCRGRKVLPPRPYLDLGRWGYAINFAALAWVIVSLLFFTFPAYMPVVGHVEDMNWAAGLVGAVLIICALQWILSSRKHYLKTSNTATDRSVTTAESTHASEKVP